MAIVATRSDALRFKVSGVEIKHLADVGNIEGVAVIAVAAANGPGTGAIKSEGDGTLLRWRAPGATVYGEAVNVAAGGSFLLEGIDRNQWARVSVTPSYLVGGPNEGRVIMGDVLNNAIGSDLVTGVESFFGDVETYTVDMVNDSPRTLRRLAVWIDPAVASRGDLEISDDGAAWVSPSTEATALGFPDLAAAASDVLHLRRTIAAMSTRLPDVLNWIHARYYAP